MHGGGTGHECRVRYCDQILTEPGTDGRVRRRLYVDPGTIRLGARNFRRARATLADLLRTILCPSGFEVAAEHQVQKKPK